MIRGIIAGCIVAGSLAGAGGSHAAKVKPLVVFDGSYASNKAAGLFDSHESRHFTYRGPITVTVVGTQIDTRRTAAAYFNVDADVVTAISVVGQVAIAPGDPRSQTLKATFAAADNKCKFGCVVSVFEAQNIKWHVVVTR